MIEAATCITFVHISATDVDYLLYEFSSRYVKFAPFSPLNVTMLL